MEADNFILVTKGHRLCAKNKKENLITYSEHHVNKDTNICSKELLYERVLQRKYDLQLENSFKINCYELCQVEEVICYGIGKISDSIIAQYQLVILLILIETLLSKVKQVLVYDPVLDDIEIDVLRQLGIRKIDRNEHCRRTVTVPTLFYMPHCGLSMYNNVLYANWSPDLLGNVFIIGNSFSTYLTRLTSSELLNKGLYINQLRDVVIERKISLNSSDDNILNDTCVHMFPRSLLKTFPSNVWTITAEPPNDEEII